MYVFKPSTGLLVRGAVGFVRRRFYRGVGITPLAVLSFVWFAGPTNGCTSPPTSAKAVVLDGTGRFGAFNLFDNVNVAGSFGKGILITGSSGVAAVNATTFIGGNVVQGAQSPGSSIGI